MICECLFCSPLDFFIFLGAKTLFQSDTLKIHSSLLFFKETKSIKNKTVEVYSTGLFLAHTQNSEGDHSDCVDLKFLDAKIAHVVRKLSAFQICDIGAFK